MHAGCTACEDLTRARAYRWLGENHWIPARHGVNWIAEDLRREIGDLRVGEELEFDYRGEVADAPMIAIRRSADGVYSAQGPAGWLDTTSHASWTWQPNDDPDPLAQLTYDLLSFIRDCRGAQSVILIQPS
jgi:hypothetical protein